MSLERERIEDGPARRAAQLEHEAELAAARLAPEPAPLEQPVSESAPLPAATRAHYEAALGHDFSRVQVHTGEAAAAAAVAEGARAFTVGSDVVFGRGAYAPESPEGRALLGHELTHTAQQRGRSPQLQRQSLTVQQPPGLGLGLFRSRPLGPSAVPSYAEIRRLNEQRMAPVRRWLQPNLNNLRILSVNAIIVRVRRSVPAAADMSDGELRATIVDWAAENNFTPAPMSAVADPADQGMPPPPTTPSPLTDNQIVGSVTRAVHAAIDGVGVTRAHGRAVVSVSGATVGLRYPGGTRVEGSVSFGGTLGLQAERGDFHFEASIGADKWEMKLSFGSDTAVPDLSRLENVFSQGESAMRHIATEVGSFRNLSDVSRIRNAIHPYTEPVSDAIEALQGIAQTPRVSVGISGSGPGMGATEPGTMPRATAITATLTVSF